MRKRRYHRRDNERRRTTPCPLRRSAAYAHGHRASGFVKRDRSRGGRGFSGDDRSRPDRSGRKDQGCGKESRCGHRRMVAGRYRTQPCRRSAGRPTCGRQRCRGGDEGVSPQRRIARCHPAVQLRPANGTACFPRLFDEHRQLPQTVHHHRCRGQHHTGPDGQGRHRPECGRLVACSVQRFCRAEGRRPGGRGDNQSAHDSDARRGVAVQDGGSWSDHRLPHRWPARLRQCRERGRGAGERHRFRRGRRCGYTAGSRYRSGQYARQAVDLSGRSRSRGHRARRPCAYHAHQPRR